MGELQIYQNGKHVTWPFREPTPLFQLLEEAGFSIFRPCGGRGQCGKCAVGLWGAVSPPTKAEQAAGIRLACQAVVRGDAVVILPFAAEESIETATVPVLMERPVAGHVGAAVDLGTTTVVLRRYDLADGRLLGEASMVNPQASVAADVMGRIDAAMHGRAGALRAQITDAIKLLLHRAGGEADRFVVEGNTAMLYLLTGRDPAPLSCAPFEADFLFDREWDGAYFPPCMHAFVGADITCAVLASGMCERGETALLCDVGTNGEIALWKNGVLHVTSMAAGPAFEGAGISCGCSGIAGAVDRAWAEQGSVRIHTIDNAPAVGLCGSGLIDVLAVLISLGQMDETGALKKDPAVLDPHVMLTQRDVRAVQLAKAAVAAGIATLLNDTDTECSEISRFYLAGGFGSRINLKSAASIGLFPRELTEKACVLGNAALAGAARLLLDRDSVGRIRKIAASSVHHELGGTEFFHRRYVEEMYFPKE